MSEGVANFITAVTALTAFSATGVAWWGLRSWKEQRVWEDNRDLGRRLLLELQDYRNHLKKVRSPIFRTSEYDQQIENAGHAEEDHGYWRRYYALDQRIRLLESKAEGLRDVFDEGCAVWGDEVETWLDDIFTLEKELLTYIRLELKSLNPDEPLEMRESIQSVLLDLRPCSTHMHGLGVGGDEYWEEFLNAFTRVKGQVRAKMKLSR